MSASALALAAVLLVPTQALSAEEVPAAEVAVSSEDAELAADGHIDIEVQADAEMQVDAEVETEAEAETQEESKLQTDGAEPNPEGLEPAAEEAEPSNNVEAETAELKAAKTASSGEVKPFQSGITRLQGDNRYDTAVQVSKRYGSGVDAVYIATGENFPDALAAAAAAASDGNPLLLTPRKSLPKAVKDEVKRLDPRRIFVVGGSGAVSSNVFRELEKVAPTARLSGGDRYSTGLKVVDRAYDSADFAVIATGRSFPDALAATSVAGLKEGPVILVDGTKKSLDRATLQMLKSKGITQIMIAGGTGVVSTGIESQLKNAGYKVDRRGGKDRYETAAKVNTAYFKNSNAEHYVLATGQDFPDALAGGALAARNGAPQFAVMPLYLTQQNCMPEVVKKSITSIGITNLVVLGGRGAVGANAAKGQVCAKPKVTTPPKSTTPPKPSGSIIPSGWDCPASHPIKGNADSGIYHVPGGSFYSRTNPEICFSSEAAARAAGYRASKV